MVLKSLSQGFYRTLFGAQKGFDRTFSGSIEPFRGSIEPSGGFDRTFLGRSPISGYRFKIPSSSYSSCRSGDTGQVANAPSFYQQLVYYTYSLGTLQLQHQEDCPEKALILWSGCASNSTETQERRIKVTQKWLKSGLGRPTPKWPKIGSKVTLASLWGGPPRVTFESLLGHFNSFCVSVELGARPPHNTNSRNRSQLQLFIPVEWMILFYKCRMNGSLMHKCVQYRTGSSLISVWTGFVQGGPGSVRSRFVHGTVRAVPVLGSDGSFGKRFSVSMLFYREAKNQ